MRIAFDDDCSVSETENDQIIKRKEVAALLGISIRGVDSMTADGVLRKIVLPNRKRAIGYSKKEVMEILK